MKPTRHNRWGAPVWEVKDEFAIWFDDGLAQVGGWSSCTFDAPELRRLAEAASAAADALGYEAEKGKAT